MNAKYNVIPNVQEMTNNVFIRLVRGDNNLQAVRKVANLSKRISCNTFSDFFTAKSRDTIIHATLNFFCTHVKYITEIEIKIL